ncbi:antitoxin [Streptosporangiaceae bacterium NEAU-GS5]|nr:antitoxin [Streptosporangiaceae bacterium NEAU-GS5]
MSIFDKVKEMFGDHEKSAGMKSKVEDTVKGGVDKGAAKADERTGGKYGGHIDKGADAARRAADKIDGQPD